MCPIFDKRQKHQRLSAKSAGKQLMDLGYFADNQKI